MAGIQLSGLASGLDTASIIAQLMQVERIPRQRIERNQAAVQQRQDLLKEIQTKLKTLKTATTDLQSGALWNPVRTATTSDATRVAARSVGGGSFTPGTYDVEVQSVSTKTTESWSTQLRNNPSDLTFTTTATGATSVVAIASNSSLDQIVAAINAQSDAPVVATNDNGALKLESKTMGAASDFTVVGQVLNVRTLEQNGTDSSFTVNGVTHTSSSNVNTTAIPGIELTLTGLTNPGTPVQITTGETQTDKAAVAAKMKAFVEAYNAVVDFTRGKITEKSDPKAATLTDAKRGVLYGDSGLTNVLSQLRLGLMDPLAGNAATLDEMHEIGVSTGAATSTIAPDKVSGKLVFDEAKFNREWDANRVGLEQLIRGDGTPTGTGFTQRMDSMLRTMTEVGGLIDGRINSAGSELKTIGNRLAVMDKRLERKEQFYKRQFTALETALSKAQSMQQQMAGQLAGLPSPSRD